ncbi:hypothetical protein PHISP_07817 [Aspergillus sp. HF37]|nr:hypothetical protein PHISP_07817 [Aspergillus sp. HF37]
MFSVKLSALSSLFLLVLAHAVADLPAPIVGCKAVFCPYSETYDNCTLGNNSFAGIGLARIPNTPSPLQGLSLVKAAGIADSADPPSASTVPGSQPYGIRPFQSAYYLGSPPELPVQNLTGCAVTFDEPPVGNFTGSGNATAEEIKAAAGTCPDILEQGCVDTITERARKAVRDAKGDGDGCSALARELERGSFDKCRGIGGGGGGNNGKKGLGNFTVSSLGDLSPITGPQNSSSDCWPVIPKAYNLAKISEDIALGEPTGASTLENLYKITPMLTVFSDRHNSPADKTSAQLTCLKVVTKHRPDAGDNTQEDQASSSSYNLLGVGMASLVALLFSVLA